MRGLRHITLVAVLAALFLVGAGGTAHAQKKPPMEVAVQDDSVFLNEIGMKRRKALNLVEQLFTTRIRVNVSWARVVKKHKKKKKPSKVRYDFAVYDALRKSAARRGIKLQLTLTTPAPAWATGNKKVGGYKIKNKYWKGFVTKTVRHFRGKVDRYAIHNEPNYVTWNGPLKSAASRYRRMYIDSYKIIRKIAPQAQVLIAETAPYAQDRRSIAPLKFLRDVAKGGKLKADGYAHHPYDFRHHLDYRYPGKDNVTIKTLGRLTRQLDKLFKSGQLTNRAGTGPPPVYLTEYGYMGSGKYKIKPESKRAKYVTKAFEMARKNSRVRQMTQYVLVKPPKYAVFFDTSLVSRKGKKTGTFKSLAKWAKKNAKAKKILVPNPPNR